MSKKQEFIEYFAQLTTDQILRLSTQRKNQLLVMLHAEVTQNGPWSERTHKTKMIAKSRKVSYKAFVRRRMPTIMNRLALRISGGEKEGEAAQAEGKSILKSALGEVERRKVENFHAHFKEIKSQQNRDELICPICLELLMSPVLTSCGHAFCFQCLDSSINFSNLCPSCRENIKGSDFIVCPLLENYVRRTVQSSLPKLYPNYCERTRKMQEWRAKREVKLRQIRLGDLLDVRDTENIWCQGTVLDIFYEGQDKECPTAILLHFNRWHKIYNQIIELPSSRIAKLSCFTGRTDIPRYNLSQEDNNMRGLVVTGPPVVQNADSDSQSDEPVPDLVPIMVRPEPQANENNTATIFNIVMQNWAARLFQVQQPDFLEANEDHNSEEASYMEIQEQQPDDNQEQSLEIGQSQEEGYNNQQEQQE